MDPQRDETPAERMDRNWSELLQEMRVTQTGVQILSGFLLTVPFQARFTDLDRAEQMLYLITTTLSLTATALIVAPVSVHRILFRRNAKDSVVTVGNTLAKVGLAALALTMSAALALIFSVVIDRAAALVAGGAAAVFFAALWLVVPVRMRRGNVGP